MCREKGQWREENGGPLLPQILSDWVCVGLNLNRFARPCRKCLFHQYSHCELGGSATESRRPRCSCWVTSRLHTSLLALLWTSCPLFKCALRPSSRGFLILLESERPDKEGMSIRTSRPFKVSSRKGQEPRGLGGTS